MTDEAFEDFWRGSRGLRRKLSTITLTQAQADEIKDFFQYRARDRENVAPSVTPCSPPARVGALGRGVSPSPRPPLRP